MGDVKPYDAEELDEVRADLARKAIATLTADLDAARGLLRECSEVLSALEPIAVYDYMHDERDADAKALLDRLRAVLARITIPTPEHSGHHTTCQRCNAPKEDGR